MASLLDLRKKVKPQIVVVEKIILKPRSFSFEILRILGVIILVSGFVWGISFASVGPQQHQKENPAIKSFSADGIVSSVDSASLTLDQVEGTAQSLYTFDLSTVKKIESNNYTALDVSDIHVGDHIIVQGIYVSDSAIEIHRIISYGNQLVTGILTVTAPDLVDSSHDVATTTVATSSEIISTSTDVVSSSTDLVSSSTLDISSSTDSTSSNPSPIASSTPDISSSTDSSSTPNNPPTIASTSDLIQTPSPVIDDPQINTSTDATSENINPPSN